ncbi:kazal-type serine protease inhibitor domain-containing protein 1-like [Styela clava]
MKAINCGLYILLVSIIFILVLEFEVSHGSKIKRQKTKNALTQSKNVEKSSADTQTSSKIKKAIERKRRVLPATQKASAKNSNLHKHKGRKIKHKNHKKNLKFQTLANEPTALATTVPPQIDEELKTEEKPTQNIAAFVNDEAVVPGWIPHVAKRKCRTCFWQECPTIDVMKRHCPSGIVRDQCNCCAQCASGVGMPCYMTSFAPIWLPPCGDDLECIPAYGGADFDDENQTPSWGSNRNSEGICSCTERTTVCGSNNATYENVCEFRESAARLKSQKISISISHPGPCNTVPTIDSAPQNTVSQTGDVVSFRCETSGFPLPRIQWFKTNKEKRKTEEIELPGYLNHAVTQMRGGPGKYQLTTWLTLDKVEETDIGDYICRSTNEYGTADGSATLTINRL